MVESSSSLLWATILVALVVITIGHVEAAPYKFQCEFKKETKNFDHNNTSVEVIGIATLSYEHEKSTLAWRVFLDSKLMNFSSLQINSAMNTMNEDSPTLFLELIHDDFWKQTKTRVQSEVFPQEKSFIMFDMSVTNNSTQNVDNSSNEKPLRIELGSSLMSSTNNTNEFLRVPDLFDSKYSLRVVVKNQDNNNQKATRQASLLLERGDDSTLIMGEKNMLTNATSTVIASGRVVNTCGASSPVVNFSIMNWQLWLVLITVLGMLIGLIFDIFRPYFVVFVALAFFLVTGIVTLKQALAGFSNDGMLAIAFLFPVVQPLSTSPMILKLSKIMFGKPRFTPRLSYLRIFFPICVLSMFLNNTPIVVLFLPLIKDWCRTYGLSPSKFLIPLAYTTTVGGMCTLIGTSTNLVVSGLMASYGYQEFSFFEFSFIGLILMVAMFLYMTTIGYSLLPDKKGGLFKYAKERSEQFLSQINIRDVNSPLIGKNKKKVLEHLHLSSLEIIEIIRPLNLSHFSHEGLTLNSRYSDEKLNTSGEGGGNYEENYITDNDDDVERITPVPDNLLIQYGDKIIFKGNPKEIMALNAITGLSDKFKDTTIYKMIGTESLRRHSLEISQQQQQHSSELLDHSSILDPAQQQSLHPHEGMTDEENQHGNPISLRDAPIPKSELQHQLLLSKQQSNQTFENDSMMPSVTTSTNADTTTRIIAEPLNSSTAPQHKDEPQVDPEFFECVIGNSNPCVGQTYHVFSQTYQVVLLAVRHRESVVRSRTESTDFYHQTVRMGDTILVFSKPDFYEKYKESLDFFIISRCNVNPKQDHRPYIVKFRGKEYNLWWWEYLMIPIFFAVVIAASLNVPMVLCAMVAFAVMVFLRLLSPVKAIASVDWQLLILVACSLGVGTGIKNSGISEAFAELLNILHIPDILLPAVVFLMTQITTQVITNNAAASLNLPLALAIAQSRSLNPQMFGMIVAIASSAEFATPIGYQCNLLVQGPGGYSFMDYVKVGAPLNVLFFILSSVFIPLIWGMKSPNFQFV